MTTRAAGIDGADEAEHVAGGWEGKGPVINPYSMAALGREVVDVRNKHINVEKGVS